LGCPHASLDEIHAAADALAGRTVTKPVWLSTSRTVYEMARGLGLVEQLERSGALVLRDTCFVVAPLRGTYHSLATTSAKGCYYSRGHNDMSVRTGTLQQCVEAAVTGRFPPGTGR